MNKLIIAIDPGERHIGIVLYETGTKTLGHTQWDLQKDGSIHKFIDKQLINQIDYYISIFNYKIEIVVIIEKFLNYTHKNNIKGFKNNQTSEYIGYIQYAMNCMGCVEVVMQTASQAKNWNDDRLNRLGLLEQAPTKRHEKDAYRHLIYYVNKNLFSNCITQSKFKKQ